MFACFEGHVDPPSHIAIIPDGNRRWQKKTGGSYQRSKDALQSLIEWCLEKGIKELSTFAWSSENWSRPQAEVTRAMDQFNTALDNWIETEQTDIAYYFVSSSPEKINIDLRNKMDKLNNITKKNKGLVVYLYLSYGFTEDVQQATGNVNFKIASVVPSFSTLPDLMIRTSGERRLSNFCLWHLRYTELLFIKPFFPDCDRPTWENCLVEYAQRKRRFGK